MKWQKVHTVHSLIFEWIRWIGAFSITSSQQKIDALLVMWRRIQPCSEKCKKITCTFAWKWFKYFCPVSLFHLGRSQTWCKLYTLIVFCTVRTFMTFNGGFEFRRNLNYLTNSLLGCWVMLNFVSWIKVWALSSCAVFDQLKKGRRFLLIVSSLPLSSWCISYRGIESHISS